MNILIVGSGGREHALAWKIAQSPLVDNLYCAPGNPGAARHGKCVDIGVDRFDALIGFARDNAVDLTVVGPEAPLADGITDCFAESGLKVFGPARAAARLEGSKAFAKEIMAQGDIPTGDYAVFDDAQAALDYVDDRQPPLVVKADGLAAGKGVTVARDRASARQAVKEAMVDGRFGEAGARILIEECLVGEEASILALTDGRTLLPLASSQDHKPVYDGDRGPNTGGMGAYSPAPVITAESAVDIRSRILEPCIAAMAEAGAPYVGVLYAGLMMTANGPKVVEFNCRFGDPEVQVVIPRMRCDIVPLLSACCDGTLDRYEADWDAAACVTVVMASGGYPGHYEKGKVIMGIEQAEQEDGVIVFHAGTREEDGRLLTDGGRVLDVTALDDGIASAIDKAYRAVDAIRFDAAHFRKDIGQKALKRTGR